MNTMTVVVGERQVTIPAAAIPDPEVRHEWEHFRGFGWEDRRIACRLGIDWTTVRKWASQFARTGTAPKHRPRATRRRELVAQMRAAGVDHSTIAERLGVSRRTVYDDCFRLGITERRTS